MDFSWFYLTFFMYYFVCFIKIININLMKSFVYMNIGFLFCKNVKVTIKSILFVIEWIGRRIILSKIIRKKSMGQ